jgi:MoaA/NifB/PqqE/SkfB family radical SAM enzyme/tetratricopeptide (TPR) repeat protein
MYVDHLLEWAKGRTAPPRRLFWFLTERCNLRCSICGTGCRPPVRAATELTTRDRLRLVDEIAELGVREAYLVGGEVFVLGRVMEKITAALKQRDIFCEATTNGTLLKPRMIEHLVDVGWDALGISVDGPDAKSHDVLRGRDGVFDAAVTAIRALNEEKARRGSDRPSVRLSVILHRDNIERIDEMLTLAQELLVDNVYFTPMTPQTDTATEHMLRPAEFPDVQSRLQDAAQRETPFEHNLSQLAGGELIEEAANLGRILSSDVSCLEPGFFRAGCLVFWDQLVLLPDGRVSPCWRHKPEGLPNARDMELAEIWYGEAMTQARTAMAGGEFPEACSGCCMPVAVENRHQRLAGLHELGEHAQVVRFCHQIRVPEHPFGQTPEYLLRSLLEQSAYSEIADLWRREEFVLKTVHLALGAENDGEIERARKLATTMLDAALSEDAAPGLSILLSPASIALKRLPTGEPDPEDKSVRHVLELWRVGLTALFTQGRSRDATRAMRALLEGSDGPWIDDLPKVLFTPYYAGEFDLVIELATAVLDRIHAQPHSLCARGAARLQLGDFDGALADLQACEALTPESRESFEEELQSSLAEIHRVRDERDASIRHAKLALAARPGKIESLACWSRVIHLFAGDGHEARALAELESLLDSSEGAEPGWLDTLLFEPHWNEKYDTAVFLAEAVLARDPGQPHSLCVRGAARGQLGDLAASMEDLQACLGLPEPQRELIEDELQTALAEVHLALGDLDTAVCHARLALEAGPEKPGGLASWGRVIGRRAELGERERAAAELEELLGHAEGADDSWYTALLFEPLWNREFDTARFLASAVLSHIPGQPHGLCIHGAARAKLGDLDGARGDLQACQALPAAVWTSFEDDLELSLAEVSLDLGDLDAAIQHVHNALEVRPDRSEGPDIWSQVVHRFARRGDLGRAHAELEALFERTEGSDAAWFIPMLFDPHRAGEFEIVIDLATAVLDRIPAQAYCSWIRGAALGKTGDLDGALEDLRACDALPSAERERFEDALQDSLAEVHLARGDLEEAVTHAKRALAISPGKVESQRTLDRAVRRLEGGGEP